MPTLLGPRYYLRRPWMTSLFQIQSQCANLRHQRPSFSILASPKFDQVNIPVGSSGSIKLDIHHPLRPAQSNPTIIYLPQGLLITRENPQESRTLASIATAANATTVRLHYRLNLPHPYPIPIHDVLAGYDWVVKHLITGSAAHNSWQAHSTKFAKLGVCGELVGGSLAAMLALTECHTNKIGVRAAALCNPITDWTMFHSSAPAREVAGDVSGERSVEYQSGVSSQPHSLSDSLLLAARRDLFVTPSHYFDPFASPLLFFRTASSDLPILDSTFSNSSPQLSDVSSSETSTEWIKKRRAYRKHPPLGSGLRLPKLRVEVGEENVFKEQVIDLAEGVMRSVELYERKEKMGTDASESEIEADKRVNLRMKKGEGFWGEEDFVDVGHWLGQILR